jgi:hypothetical protein
MSWASVASTPTKAASAQKSLPAPAKQNERGSVVPKNPAVKIGSTAKPRAKNNSKPPPITPKSSSWASNPAGKSTSASPKASPKIPTRHPLPSASKSVPGAHTAISRSISSTDTYSLSTLPTDILTHHLLPVLQHASSIRVLRLVCCHLARSILLPRVVFNLNQGVAEPFFGALAVCDYARLNFVHNSLFEKAMVYLRRNTKLRRIRFESFCSLEIEAVRSLASVLETAELKKIHLDLQFMPDSHLALLNGALQRQQSPLEKVEVHFDGKEPDKHLINFINCIAARNTRKLVFHVPNLSINGAIAIATWISSPSCSLIDLDIPVSLNTETMTIIIESIKHNRSLRRLSLCEIWDTSLLADSVIQQGCLEFLRVSTLSQADFRPLFNLLLRNKKLHCEVPHFPSGGLVRGSLEPKELIEFIKSPTCYSSFPRLLRLVWIFDAPLPSLLDALRSNTTFREMFIHMYGTEIDQFCCPVISSSKTLRSLSISSAFAAFPEELATALKQNTSIEELTLEQIGIPGLDTAVARKTITGIARLRNLTQICLQRCSIDIFVAEFSKFVESYKKIRVVDIRGCKMSEATLTRLLNSAAGNANLENWKMDQVTIESLSPSRQAFNDALVKMLSANPIQILSMANLELDPSTINAVAGCIDAMSTMTLRVLSLWRVNMPPVVKHRLQALVARKGGLLYVKL